jgi:hypothetical protein
LGVSPFGVVSAHIRVADGFNGAAIGQPLFAKGLPDDLCNGFA